MLFSHLRSHKRSFYHKRKIRFFTICPEPLCQTGKKQILLNVDVDTIDYFKELSRNSEKASKVIDIIVQEKKELAI